MSLVDLEDRKTNRMREIERRMSDECNCTFDWMDGDDPDDEYNYLRVCLDCGWQWWTLHCAHEAPRQCPKCGAIQRGGSA